MRKPGPASAETRDMADDEKTTRNSKSRRLRVPIDWPVTILELTDSLALVVDEDIAAWCWDGDVIAMAHRGNA